MLRSRVRESPGLIYISFSFLQLRRDSSVGKKFGRVVQRIVERMAMGDVVERSVLVEGRQALSKELVYSSLLGFC